MTRNFLVLVCCLGLAACSEQPSSSAPASANSQTHKAIGAPVYFVDLDAVARATGSDEVMQAQLDKARTDLTNQIKSRAAELETMLTEERTRIGASGSDEEQRNLARMALQAQQQLQKLRDDAEGLAEGRRQELMQRFQSEVTVFAREAARVRGGGAVIALNEVVMWVEPGLDLTDEVLARMRAQGQQVPANAAGNPFGDTADNHVDTKAGGNPAETSNNKKPGDAIDGQ